MMQTGKRVLLLLMTLGLLYAQDYKGKVHVTITSDDGQPVNGAVVVLASSTFNRSFTSDETGVVRFVGLEPDTYELKVTMGGFNTFVRPNIVVDTGANVRIPVGLKPETQQQEMVVTATTPLMDRQDVSSSTVLTAEELQLLPQARDPWSVMSTVPSIQTDRINIGGSEAGQQSVFTSKGDDGNNASWVMDGVEFTDMAARGASASYLDFSSFAQIGITTGGADATQRSAGVRTNLVTKKGSNETTGSMRLLWADSNFQSHNNDGITTLSGAPFKGNRISETFEKSFEIGGPLIKDKLWYWGAFSQNLIDTTIITGASDKTTLENLSLKLHGDITSTTRFNIFYTEGDKIKNGRGADATRPRNTTWDQKGPTPILKMEISQLIGENTELTATYGRVDGKFSLTPIGPQDLQIAINMDNGVWDDTTFFNYGTVRPTRQYEVKGNTYLNAGNMEHEFQYGFKYLDGTVSSYSIAGDDQLVAYYYPSDPSLNYVQLYREGNLSIAAETTSLYLSDKATYGNWTFSFGLRYDEQTGNNEATSSRANRFAPDLLPNLNFQGQPKPFTWENIAPRVGATYNWGEDNQYLLRGNAAIYYDTLGTGMIQTTNPAWYVTSIHVWNDDGDHLVETGEIGDYLGGSQDINNPVAQTTINPIDPDLKAPQTTELTFGFEYAMTPEFSLAADYTWRKRDDVLENRLLNITSADYYLQRTVNAVNFDTGATVAVPIYALTEAGGAKNPNRSAILTNRPGYSENYTGLELTATKRLSNKWMMRANFTIQDWTRDVDMSQQNNPNQFQDGRNEDGGDVAIQSTGSGSKGNVWLGSSKWQGNINGLYQLPWDVTISGNLMFRQGFSAPLGYRTGVTDDDGYFHNINTATDPWHALYTVFAVGNTSDFRYDDVFNFDMKLTKTFTMGTTRVELAAEIFNVFNENTALQKNLLMNQSTRGEVREIISPRIGRFSATVNF